MNGSFHGFLMKARFIFFAPYCLVFPPIPIFIFRSDKCDCIYFGVKMAINEQRKRGFNLLPSLSNRNEDVARNKFVERRGTM